MEQATDGVLDKHMLAKMGAIMPLVLKRVDGLLRERFAEAVKARYQQGELKVSIALGINLNLSTALVQSDVSMTIPTTLKFKAHDEIEVDPGQLKLPMDIPPNMGGLSVSIRADGGSPVGSSEQGVEEPAAEAFESEDEAVPVSLPDPEPEPPKKRGRKKVAKGAR